ncbi:MAG TPA: toxin-antitoxin system YwqK family antitoxin [Saprospiraceae bacterium]|nr:toxin-antitoxin system YwqK family antitoxin [Saprospiraceae bacterium]
MNFPSITLLSFITLCAFACNRVKTVEDRDGNMIDRYTVDKEGRRHGEFRRYFGKDTLAEVSTYVHGLLHGPRTIYNQQGTPEIVENYVKDTLDGPYKVYYENGDVKIEGEYVDGTMLGIWKRYYPGGRILEEVTYSDNVENGPFTEYHENGKLRAKGQYLEGDFEHDTLYLFDENGVLERKMLCDRGVCKTLWLAQGVLDEK